MADKIILDAKMTGTLDGKDLKGPYRVVIEKKNNEWSLHPEQAFKNEGTGKYEYNEFSGLPSWKLDSLSDFPHDMIWIDTGLRWGIKGMQEAIKEAIQKTY